MPKKQKSEEWPQDPNESAVRVAKIATGEIQDETSREDELTEEQRSEIAKHAGKG